MTSANVEYPVIEPAPSFVQFDDMPKINDPDLAFSIAETMGRSYDLMAEATERRQIVNSKYPELEESEVELVVITGYGFRPGDNNWQLKHLELLRQFENDENVQFLLKNKLLNALDPDYTGVWYVPAHWFEPDDTPETVKAKAIDHQVCGVLDVVLRRGQQAAHSAAERVYLNYLRDQELEAYRELYDERDIALFGTAEAAARSGQILRFSGDGYGRSEYEKIQSELTGYRKVAEARQAVISIVSALGGDPRKFLDTAAREDIVRIAKLGDSLKHLLDS